MYNQAMQRAARELVLQSMVAGRSLNDDLTKDFNLRLATRAVRAVRTLLPQDDGAMPPERLMVQKLHFPESTLFQPLISADSEFCSSFHLLDQAYASIDPDITRSLDAVATNANSSAASNIGPHPAPTRHAFPTGSSLLSIPVAQIEKPEPPGRTAPANDEATKKLLAEDWIWGLEWYTAAQQARLRVPSFVRAQNNFADVYLDPLKPRRLHPPLGLAFASASPVECNQHRDATHIQSTLLAAEAFGLLWSKTDSAVSFPPSWPHGGYLYHEVLRLWQLLQWAAVCSLNVLRQEWRNKSEQDRIKIIESILADCPGLVLRTHASDTDTLYEALVTNSEEFAEASSQQPRINAGNVTIPQLNLQDLREKETVLLLFQTRVERQPLAFAWQDLDRSRLERLCLNHGREAQGSIRFLQMVGGQQMTTRRGGYTAGTVLDADEERVSQCSSFSCRDSVHHLKIEKSILRFLWSWVRKLLTEKDLDNIIYQVKRGTQETWHLPDKLPAMPFIKSHRSGDFRKHLMDSQYRAPPENILNATVVLTSMINALQTGTEELKNYPPAFVTQARDFYEHLQQSIIPPGGCGALRKELRSTDAGLYKIAVATTALEKPVWLAALRHLERNLTGVFSRSITTENAKTEPLRMTPSYATQLKGAMSSVIFLRKLCDDQLANMLLDYAVFSRHFNSELLPSGEVLRTRKESKSELADILDATINRSEFDHRFGAWRKIELIERAISRAEPEDLPLPSRFTDMLRIMYALAISEREVAAHQPWVMLANYTDTVGLTDVMKLMLNREIIEEALLQEPDFEYPNIDTIEIGMYTRSGLPRDPEDGGAAAESAPVDPVPHVMADQQPFDPIPLIVMNQKIELEFQMFWSRFDDVVEGSAGQGFEEQFPTFRRNEPWVTIGGEETQQYWDSVAKPRIDDAMRLGNVGAETEAAEAAEAEVAEAADLAEGENADEPEADEPEVDELEIGELELDEPEAATVPAPMGRRARKQARRRARRLAEQAAPADQPADQPATEEVVLTPVYLDDEDLHDIHAIFGIGTTRLRRKEFENLMAKCGFAVRRVKVGTRLVPVEGDAFDRHLGNVTLHMLHSDNDYMDHDRLKDHGNVLWNRYKWTAAKFRHKSEKPK